MPVAIINWNLKYFYIEKYVSFKVKYICGKTAWPDSKMGTSSDDKSSQDSHGSQIVVKTCAQLHTNETW